MNLSAELIQATLKNLLKSKKISYEKIASSLNLSEVTIKRILNSKDISLDRLIQICSYLEIDLLQLCELAKSTKTEKCTFTDEQEEYLAKNKYTYAYLELLYDMSPNKIREKYNLNEASQNYYLRELERQDLIYLDKNDQYRLTYPIKPDLKINGPMSKAYGLITLSNFNREVERQLALHFGHLDGEIPRNLIALTDELKISSQNWTILRKDLYDLFEKLAKISELDQTLLNEKDLITLGYSFGVITSNQDEKIISPKKLFDIDPINID